MLILIRDQPEGISALVVRTDKPCNTCPFRLIDKNNSTNRLNRARAYKEIALSATQNTPYMWR